MLDCQAMTEEVIQTRAVEYLRLAYPKSKFCASLGGIRTGFRQAKKAKATGYVKGFPDLFIYQPVVKDDRVYCGMAIEIKKAQNSYATPEQKQWIQHLNDVGYYAVIAKGLPMILDEIDNYLKESEKYKFKTI